MKAIVTGATGFLGQHLVAYLQEQGWLVIALGRNNVVGQQLNSKHIKFKNADICDLDALSKSFESADAVFHCAAKSSDWGDEKQFYAVNVVGTKNVVTCANQFNIKKFIYVSSTSVYFEFTDKFNICETSGVAAQFANAYAKTKYLGEQVVLNEFVNEKVIIRPRGIFGEGDNTLMPRILKLAAKGKFPLINGGKAKIDITYVKNVCVALHLAAIKMGIDGEIFNISNQEPMIVKNILETVFDSLGMSVKFIKIPYWFISTLARIYESIFKNNLIVTYYGIGLLAKSQTLNIDKAKNILGYVPLYTIRDGINNYVEWYENKII